jgi:23S rRNA (cytidine1920-2'-O)/16S rRNA (cytidine1409-2'-O)-methyltransferase
MPDTPSQFVSRGGLKIEAALDTFEIDPTDFTCADLGCNVGGFTDCLLQRNAKKVFAVDTAYGQLAWKLRQDERVTVLERTNAMHFEPESLDGFQACDLVVIDLGWTRQNKAIPVALKWLNQSPDARVISLIKPHYESTETSGEKRQRKGVLSPEQSQQICQQTLQTMPELGVEVIHHIPSPIRGGGKRGKKPGNIEYLALCKRA